MTDTTTETRPGRRTWRAAVVVFLTVFLGGLGITGAAALWSQSGTVTATVTTGTWSDGSVRWQDITAYASAEEWSKGQGYFDVVVDWSGLTLGESATYSLRITDESVLTNGNVKVSRAGSADTWHFSFQKNNRVTIPMELIATQDGVKRTVVRFGLTIHDTKTFAITDFPGS